MKKIIAIALALVLTLSLAACGKTPVPESETALNGITLSYESKDVNTFATHFEIFNFEKGIKLIATYDVDQKLAARILVLPKGEKPTTDLPDDVIVLNAPVKNLLLESAPTMSLINALDAVSSVRFTASTTWYIDSVKKALADKTMIDIGDPSAPDYEVIAANMPDLGIFSVMPKVTDQLKELGLKFIVDQSIYEADPLGRTEWVKMYGAMLGCEDKAEEVFAAQLAITKKVEDNLKSVEEKDKKSVVFFYVDSKGLFKVRNSDDYLSNAIEKAGGKLLDFNEGTSGLSHKTIEKELFFNIAKEADVLIYNYSMGGKPQDLKDLEGRFGDILKDMKAFKLGNIWTTSQNFYQVTDSIGAMVGDLYTALYDSATVENLTYLNRLK